MTSKIIQFLHPGVEHSYKIENEWNIGKHKRKFLKHSGICLKGSKKIKTDLVFWAEWEAQSRIIKKYKPPKLGLPKTLFEPYYSFKNISKKNILTNTDPFIFGNFIFSICQKYRRNNPTCLANNLNPGDIILFGSNHKKAFHLDLVFVVKNEITVTSKNYKKKLNGVVDQTYLDVTLDKIFKGTCNDGCNQSIKEIIIHLGVTYDDPIEGMYCFVPCQLFNKIYNGFPRPVIKKRNIISDGLNRSFKVYSSKNIKENKEFWDDISNYLDKINLLQGIYIDPIYKSS